MSGNPAKSRPPPKGIATSANGAATFTPNDGADLPGGPCFGFSVATAGIYVVTFTDDPAGTQTQVYCAPGWNPWGVKRIYATGSAATAGVMPVY